MGIEKRIRAELTALESQAQFRRVEVVRGVNLVSNDYLGLATDPRMRQAVLDAVQAAPRVASTGSRLLSGHDEAWDALEREFARWIGADAALYFTSGYAANLGLLSALLRPEDVVFSDSANHASLIDGLRLSKCRRVIFPHRDLNVLEDELGRRGAGPGERFIVVESIFSMEGDRAPLADLAGLAARHGAALIVDEAHATGVCGPNGRGCIAEAGLSGRIFATVHTCGKALAAAGAFVCGSESLRQFLINRARPFIFNTALPPYFAAQVATGMRLAAAAEEERAQLHVLSNFLRQELRAAGFDTAASDSQIVPVILGDNASTLAIASRLQGRGFGVRAIRPPSVPHGAGRLRVSVNARHSQSQLAEFAAALLEIRMERATAHAAL